MEAPLHIYPVFRLWLLYHFGKGIIRSTHSGYVFLYIGLSIGFNLMPYMSSWFQLLVLDQLEVLGGPQWMKTDMSVPRC